MKLKLRLLLLCAAAVVCVLVSCGNGNTSGSFSIDFDTPPGIYQARFALKINCSDQSLEIRYTVDSSIPTSESDLYNGEDGISIAYRGGGLSDPSSVNIVRCQAFDSGGNRVGETLTGTYILADSPDIRYSTMIVSVVCEPDDLYNYERGILVTGKVRDDFLKERPPYWTNDSLKDANYFRSGIEWERPAHVEFYTQTGDLMLKQNVGVRVSGGWNRNNEHKSLRLFARYSYAPANVMSFDAYSGLTSLTGVPVADFKTLILRTGSNNMWNTTIQTPFLIQLGAEVGIETMHYRPICVYINGKYYGYMALFEDYSTTYFETHYNISSDEITCINGTAIISGGREWSIDNGPESDMKEFTKMLNYITSLDMREEAYYKKASEMLDFDSFIKYMCFEGYISNSDWPQNNVRAWRRFTDGYNPEGTEYGFDGRWRFLLKDLDLAAGYSGDKVTESIFKRLDSDDGGLRLNAIFKSLFRNDDFKNRVYCFLCDLLSTTMQVDNVMAKLGEVEASALLEMRYYTKSYNASGGSPEKWHTHLETPARFFVNRYTAVYNELPKKYNSVYGKITIEIEGEGELKVSTLTLGSETELEYLIGLNIPVSAEPAKGWRLKELLINGIDTNGIIANGKFLMTLNESTLSAVFEPDPDYIEYKFDEYKSGKTNSGLVINELKYNHSLYDESPDLVELYNAGDESIYLKGYILVKKGLRSDGTPDTDKWDFPAVTIGAGEYMVIACDKIGTVKGQSDYHASFGIGIGDTLSVVDRLGNEVDKAELTNCNNFVVLARDGDEWYFAPYATFGEPNVKSDGYSLANLIDERARGVFIHKGRLISNFAEGENGSYTITERSIRENFSADMFEKNKSKLEKIKTGTVYDLDGALDIFGYRRYYIPSLESNVIYKK